MRWRTHEGVRGRDANKAAQELSQISGGQHFFFDANPVPQGDRTQGHFVAMTQNGPMIHVSVRVAPVRGALSHDDRGLLKFFTHS